MTFHIIRRAGGGLNWAPDRGHMADHIGPRLWRPRSGFGARYRFCKTKKKSSYFSPSDNFFWGVLQKRKRTPKPLLGRQNCVTQAGGRHNLVPEGNSLRRGPVISPKNSIKFLFVISKFLSLLIVILSRTFVYPFNRPSALLPKLLGFYICKTNKKHYSQLLPYVYINIHYW